jgi:hypothetical protein
VVTIKDRHHPKAEEKKTWWRPLDRSNHIRVGGLSQAIKAHKNGVTN